MFFFLFSYWFDQWQIELISLSWVCFAWWVISSRSYLNQESCIIFSPTCWVEERNDRVAVVVTNNPDRVKSPQCAFHYDTTTNRPMVAVTQCSLILVELENPWTWDTEIKSIFRAELRFMKPVSMKSCFHGLCDNPKTQIKYPLAKSNKLLPFYQPCYLDNVARLKEKELFNVYRI